MTFGSHLRKVAFAMSGTALVLAILYREGTRTIPGYIFAAATGGVILSFGLILETVFEKKANGLQRLLKSLGEILVMCGVFIETVLAVFSYRGALPFQKVTSITATAEICVSGTNWDWSKGMLFQTSQPTNPLVLANPQSCFMAIGGPPQLVQSTTELPVMYGTGVYIPIDRSNGVFKLSYSLPADSLDAFSDDTVADIAKLNVAESWISALTTNDRVTGTTLKFIANGMKMPPLTFPPQIPRGTPINYTNFMDGRHRSMTVFCGTNHLNQN
jgi:hypothetical protein